MRNRNHAVLAGPAVLASLLLLAACGDGNGGGGSQKADTTAAVASADSACTAPASWFPTVQQPVNFQVDDNNCNFHLWAWQEFMWLMQPSSGGGPANFLGFADPVDLFVANPLPYPGRATSEPLTFRLRDVKDDETVDAESIAQAGGGGVLIDQAGQPVFYAIAVDSTWYNFARTNGFNTQAGFGGASDTLNFPTAGTGAIEVKSSWRVAAIGDSVLIPDASSRFFTTRTRIPTVTIVDSQFVADTTKMRDATLALVGMHVVGTVPGHPEFIWATFEQVDNAPMCSATPAPARNDSTGNPWSLYPGGVDCATGKCNQVNKPAAFNAIPICRVLAYGDTSTTSPNALNIQSLNASVQGQLASNSILRSYRLVGGQWTTPGGLPATLGSGSNVRGSPRLANTTMESFHQGSIPDGSGALTCFTCHNGGTTRSPKKLDVSHVWPLSFVD
jgi:hypothetical protein